MTLLMCPHHLIDIRIQFPHKAIHIAFMLAAVVFPDALVTAATEEEIARDLKRATEVPTAGSLAQPALTNIESSGPRTPIFDSIEHQRIRELLVSSYRARTMIKRPVGARSTDPLLLTRGIPARIGPRRWNKDISVFVDRELGIESTLRNAVDSLSRQIKRDIRVDTFEISGAPADVVIGGFGYALVGHSLVTYDLLLSPIKSTLSQPPRLNRQYCFSRSFRPQTTLRCVSFEALVKKYYSRFGDEGPFWSDAVVFTPNEWSHADGFLAANANNEIYFSQCFVPFTQPIEVRAQLGLECLIRSLGLPGGTEFSETSALATKVFQVDPQPSRKRHDPYMFDVRMNIETNELTPGPAPTEYDLNLLHRLYQSPGG